MDEVANIVMMVVALLLGLALIGWCYGDFQRPTGSTTPKAKL